MAPGAGGGSEEDSSRVGCMLGWCRVYMSAWSGQVNGAWLGSCGVGAPYVRVCVEYKCVGWTHSRRRRRPPYCRRPGSLLSIPGDSWLFRLGCICHRGCHAQRGLEGTEVTSRSCHSCRRKGRKAKASRSCRWSRRSWSRCCLRRSWRTLRRQRAPTVQPSLSVHSQATMLLQPYCYLS